MHNRLNRGVEVFLGIGGGMLFVALIDALLGFNAGAIGNLVVGVFFVFIGVIIASIFLD